ncbi:MAG: exodeoxyribonuclease III [Zoogloeaceae bacterium]|jgi:exodeoxyribonuclease-3|nr:exodeoxyribonuclease III [Zoogloeaceae bacterium]
MKIVSANLNGIRSAARKGFFEWLKIEDADLYCLQEVRAQGADLAPFAQIGAYDGHFYCAEKKGYAGVGLYARRAPDRIKTGIGVPEFDADGRVLRADFGELTVVTVYVPSGSADETRQAAKYRFLDAFFPFLDKLKAERPHTVVCGDWNIAHQNIDIKNWRGNQKNSGFLPEERDWLTRLYAAGWVDVFRALHPAEAEAGYTWWSNRGQAYAKNVGWRIDLQVATPALAERARIAWVYKTQKFSDHAPLIVDYAL